MASRPVASLTGDMIKRVLQPVVGVPTVIIGPDGNRMNVLATVSAHDKRAAPYVDGEE